MGELHRLKTEIAAVLIETYWNVNHDCRHTFSALCGINRNILECKLHSLLSVSSVMFCINRNILECKYALQAQLANCCCVLIETYWNVNRHKGVEVTPPEWY